MIIQQVHGAVRLPWRRMSHEYVTEMINEHTEHRSIAKIDGPLRGADVFHVHCVPPSWMTREHLSRTMLFFHGIAPLQLSVQMLGWKDVVGIDRCFIPAQQHALHYEAFRGFRMLRNPIMLNDFPQTPLVTDTVRVVVPCSSRSYRGTLGYKGYDETVAIVRAVAERSGGRLVMDNFVSLPRKQYIERIFAGNVVIDSLPVPSYERVNLEAAAAGRYSIAWMTDDARRLFKRITGSGSTPFRLVRLDQLRDELYRLVEGGPRILWAKAASARRWMHRYWHPRDIAQDYINAYEYILSLPAVA